MLKALSKSNHYPVDFSGAKFIFRALSGREFRVIEELEGTTKFSGIFDCIKSALVGWENVLVDEPAAIEQLRADGVPLKATETEGVFEVPYDAKWLDLILSSDDAGEVLGLMIKGNRPDKAELGKSGSPAPSTPA
jgi:hypothetical protein